ncbi:MAG: hypothetical protein N4A54_00320 [Peptostreptococcaceae bacterium]|nr:hypothetical protein [Peptostreptococcaceae bacterium]
MKKKLFKVLGLCICLLVANISLVNAINVDDELNLGQKNLHENISILNVVEDSDDAFYESDQEGIINNNINIKINDEDMSFDTTIKDMDVDVISSASALDTVPKGMNLKLNVIDEKTLSLKLENKANLSKEEDSTHIKLILLKDFFNNANENFSGDEIELSINFTDDDEIIKTNIINKDKSKIYDIENTLYAVLVLNEGSISDYKFFIDDKEVEFKKVNKSGTVLKLEVSSFDMQNLKIIGNNKEESFKLSM